MFAGKQGMGTADESSPEKTRCNVSLHTPADTVHIHVHCNTDSIRCQEACVIAQYFHMQIGICVIQIL